METNQYEKRQDRERENKTCLIFHEPISDVTREQSRRIEKCYKMASGNLSISDAETLNFLEYHRYRNKNTTEMNLHYGPTNEDEDIKYTIIFRIIHSWVRRL